MLLYASLEEDILYVLLERYDETPYIFCSVKNIPKTNKSVYIEVINEDETDDDGNNVRDEIEVNPIPTNYYPLLEFSNERENKRFKELVKRYYSKEIA